MGVPVKLASRAKIGGRWREPGETLWVTPDDADDLKKAGAISGAPRVDSDTASGLPGFDEAVAAAARDLADSAVEEAVGAAMREFEGEKNALIARATEAETQRDQLQARVLELQDRLAALPAVEPEHPPASADGGEAGPKDAPGGAAAAKPATKARAAKKG